jgi:uncharacterized protein YjiS (DUF1127 family)
MTLLNSTSSHSVTSAEIRKSVRYSILRLGRFINGLVAAVIAERERQAQLTILRRLSDRDLQDIGLYRSEIGYGLAEAAKIRSRFQQ